MRNLIILSLLTKLVMAGNDFYINREGVDVRIDGNQAKINTVQRYRGDSSSTLSPYMGYYLSDDEICSTKDDEFLGESSVSTLSSNDLSDSEKITVELPPKALKGVWYICAIADYKNQYSETDESNNASYREIEDGKMYGIEQHVPDVRYFLSYDKERNILSIRYFTRNIDPKYQIEMEYSFDKSNWKELDVNSNEGLLTPTIEGLSKHRKIYVKVHFFEYDPYINGEFDHWTKVRELSYTPNGQANNKVEGSVYDGTGSLISPKYKGWGSDRDEAIMHPHINKNSTVTFQYLYDAVNCDHIDIHSNIDLKQDVLINVKEWSADRVEKSYKAKLPVGSAQTKNGISIKTNHKWTTLAVTTTKPIKEKASIYAFCRSSIDTLNTLGVEEVDAQMTELDEGHKHLGNGSLISTTGDNGQQGIGRTMDVAITSDSDDAESSFQIRSSKGTCEEVTLVDSEHNTEIEEVLIKEWSEEKWHQTTCSSLPCKLKVYFSKDGNPAYTLINAKTKAGHNGKLYAVCGTEEVKFDIDEKNAQYRHPNSCKFTDVSVTNPNYQYITALCSTQIIHGYKSTNYTTYQPESPVLWQELTKVVQLSENFYKTKKLQESYSSGNWYDVYIDLAKKEGFYKEPSEKVKRGYAFKYIVSVFWKKENMSEDDASNFLKTKGVISKLDTNKYLKRGDMARVVLYASRLSADESNIERKLAYVDYKDENINSTKILPEDTFQTPKATDSNSKKNEIINKNLEEAKRNNTTLSGKGHTNNDALTKSILGGDKALKDEYQNKSAKEIMDKAKEKGVAKSVNANTKIKPNSMVKIKDINTGKVITALTSQNLDSKGNAKITLENKHNEVNDFTKDELEHNDLRVESQVLNIEILKDK